MRDKLKFQYYYKVDGCPGRDADDSRCICWHEEGTGPRKDERHDSDVPNVEWRAKPDNTALSRPGVPGSA